MEQPFVTGSVQTVAGPIPTVAAFLALQDHWGTFKVRWAVGRMHYTVEPGLYGIGNPDGDCPVFITANYKLSFDKLRAALPGRHAWILVLDTKGINVWCAAGKGSFGTVELTERIKSSRLAEIVTHRRLILPQLGAPGISAHQVKKLSGFRVLYGPIKAIDLPAFLDADLHATAAMRLKTFPLSERLVLIPVELVAALKAFALLLPIIFLLGGLGGPQQFWSNAMNYGLFAVWGVLIAVFAGAILAPLLLPWLPGRAFALKGLSLGLLLACLYALLRGLDFGSPAGSLELLSWFFIIPAISAYLAMNFTGASTYTSLSGVKKEMRWALPLEIVAGVTGFGLWIASRLMA